MKLLECDLAKILLFEFVGAVLSLGADLRHFLQVARMGFYGELEHVLALHVNCV